LLLTSLAAPTAGFAQTAATTTELNPQLQQLVSAVSEARLTEIVNKLAGFGTRNTLSSTTSDTRGIGAARQWIFDELRRSSTRLQVSFDTYKVAKDGRITRNVELRNILAVLPGRSARRIYLTAHYDTVNIGEAGQIGANSRAAGQRAADPQLRGSEL
jgi:acetylornithine deacetylase/succinyl-diaminopimelate desuccinylase-like protein